MRVFSGSWMEGDVGFLHAGYISGSPRPLEMHMVQCRLPLVKQKPLQEAQTGTGEVVQRKMVEGEASSQRAQEAFSREEVIDIAQALRLEGEVLAASPSTFAMPQMEFQFVSGTFLYSVVVVFFAFLLSFHGIRARKNLRSAALLVGFVIVGLLMGYAVLRLWPERAAPWDKIPPRKYVEPGLATKVLMHGIIENAMMSVPNRITSLARISRLVSLPIEQLTEGEAYALQTYGIDGWGRPFRFDCTCVEEGFLWHNRYVYHVVSAGPDGVFDSYDDIRHGLNLPGSFTWDSMTSALFAQENGEEFVYLYRCWNGRLFHARDPAKAEALTGTDLYDILAVPPDTGPTEERNRAWYFHSIERDCRERRKGLPYEPLFLIPLRPEQYVK